MPANQPSGTPLNQPPGTPLNQQAGMPPNQQPDIPPNQPPGMPANQPPGTPSNVPPGMPLNQPPGMSSNVPPGISPNLPPGTPPNLPPGTPSNQPPGMPSTQPPNQPPGMPPDWPYRSHIRRVNSPPHDWCVLDIGTGPVILLLHGAGGSGHSFRALIPYLAHRFRVIVPDLPGQGFTRTGARGRFGLDAMAQDLTRLCAAQGWQPAVVLGHSAGAAIALAMAETLPQKPQAVVGINAALGSFEGAAGVLFPLMARVLALLPLIPTVVSKLWGTPSRVDTLLASTGSRIDAAGRAQYLTLVRDPRHIEGTLGMMAQWQLDGLLARLPAQTVPVLLIASAGDRAVPPRVSERAGAGMKAAKVVVMPKLGHLAHEEAAEDVARMMLDWLDSAVR